MNGLLNIYNQITRLSANNRCYKQTDYVKGYQDALDTLANIAKAQIETELENIKASVIVAKMARENYEKVYKG